jgi:hypothetical protein
VIRTLATSIVREPNHALGGCGREAGVDKLDHVADRESVREQDAFRATVIAGPSNSSARMRLGLMMVCFRRGSASFRVVASGRVTKAAGSHSRIV